MAFEVQRISDHHDTHSTTALNQFNLTIGNSAFGKSTLYRKLKRYNIT